MAIPVSDLYYKDIIAQRTPIDFGVAEMDWGPAPFLHQQFSQFNRLGYGNDQSFTYCQAINHWFKLQYGKELTNKDVIYVGSLKYAIKTIFNLESGVKNVLNFTPYYNGYQDIFSPDINLVNYDFEQLELDLASNSIVETMISSTNNIDTDSDINTNSNTNTNVNSLEQFILNHQIKFILLSNPHNPTGKILTDLALTKLIHLAKKHQIYLIVDEAHADIVYFKEKTSLQSTMPSAAFSDYDRCFCLRSIGKTFNVSGIGGGYLIARLSPYTQTLRQIIRYDGQSSPNVFGYWLTVKGYSTQGKTYIDELNYYFFAQKEFLAQALAQYCGDYISYQVQAGTYLAWVEYSKLPVSEEQLDAFLTAAQIKVNFASAYGQNKKFFRVNIATSRDKLCMLIKQLNAATNLFTSNHIPCNL